MSEIDQHWLTAFLFSALATLSLMWWRDSHDTKEAIDWLEDENNRLSEEHNDLVDMCKNLLNIIDTCEGSTSAWRGRDPTILELAEILKDIDECVNPNCQSGTRIKELKNE
mgnify:CR=1 FL=1